MSLGVEAIGEDLEGFWEADEAEGGARLLVGPSLHVSPHKQRWQLIATGGPLFHPTDTGRSSSAFRDLPPDTNRTSYAVQGVVVDRARLRALSYTPDVSEFTELGCSR